MVFLPCELMRWSRLVAIVLSCALLFTYFFAGCGTSTCMLYVTISMVIVPEQKYLFIFYLVIIRVLLCLKANHGEISFYSYVLWNKLFSLDFILYGILYCFLTVY